MRLWHRRFPVNFAKFPRTPFPRKTSGWLLLTRVFQRLRHFILATDLFLYLLKTSENQRFSNVFRGYRKKTSDIKWVNSLKTKLILPSYRNQPVDLLWKSIRGFYMMGTITLYWVKKMLYLRCVLRTSVKHIRWSVSWK